MREISSTRTGLSHRRRERGVAIVLSAGAMVVLLILSGIAIDGARLLNAREAVANAVTVGTARAVLDHTNRSASMEIARYRGETTIARNIREAGYQPVDGSVSVTFETSENQAHGTAAATVPLYLLRFFRSDITIVSSRADYLRQKAAIVVLADRSGSMCSRALGDVPAGNSNTWHTCARMQAIVDSADPLLRPLSPEFDMAGLVLFNGWTETAQGLESPLDKDRLKRAFDHLMPLTYDPHDYHGTNMLIGLRNATLAYKNVRFRGGAGMHMYGDQVVDFSRDPTYQKLVILITDGAATESVGEYGGGFYDTIPLDDFTGPRPRRWETQYPTPGARGYPGNRTPLERARSEANYLTTLEQANYMRATMPNLRLVTIGLGAMPVESPTDTDPYDDIWDTIAPKPKFMRLLALDYDAGKNDPPFTNSFVLPDEIVFGTTNPQTHSYTEVPTYAELLGQGQKPGVFIKAEDPRTLKRKIKGLLAFMSGRTLAPAVPGIDPHCPECEVQPSFSNG